MAPPMKHTAVLSVLCLATVADAFGRKKKDPEPPPSVLESEPAAQFLMWKGLYAFGINNYEIALAGYVAYLATKAIWAKPVLPLPIRAVLAVCFEVTRANIIIVAVTAASSNIAPYDIGGSLPFPAWPGVVFAGTVAGYFAGLLVGGLEMRPGDSAWKAKSGMVGAALYYFSILDATTRPLLEAQNLSVAAADWAPGCHCATVLLLAVWAVVREATYEHVEPRTEADSYKESLRMPLLKVAFNAIDKDKSGSIDAGELAEFGQYVGNREWDKAGIAAVFKRMDTNKDGKIDLGEFQAFCFRETTKTSNEAFQSMVRSFVEVGNMVDENLKLINSVYDKIDLDGNGFVTRDEMMEFGLFMNSKFDNAKLNKLMKQMDLDLDGKISREEFIGYFAKLSKPVDDTSFIKGMTRYLKFEKGKAPHAKASAAASDVKLGRD